MKTWLTIVVRETDEVFHAKNEADAVKWMQHTRRIAEIWGGAPHFDVTRHTEESIFLNDVAIVAASQPTNANANGGVA